MHQWKRGVAVALAVLLIAVSGVAVYFSFPQQGHTSSVRSVQDDPRISVSSADGVGVLSPTETNSTTGLVFYPGARVAPDAYYRALAPLVTRANVTVFVPTMPLNVALLDPDAAESIRTSHPHIRTWAVGGHSLGGVAACQYTDSNPGDVRGLVLLASYCNGDVSDQSLAVLSVTGSADTVLDRENYRAGRTRLPPNATFHEIRGMNHTQFGSYRGQRGDSRAPLSYDEAHRRLAEVLVSWARDHLDSGQSRSIGGDGKDGPLQPIPRESWTLAANR
ncbi:alpha/beta hydrolase [Halorussus salilacus]|uniref:alpha/beta hydrolase n=1 Tax=Halorussus salilacus TaxID=2953750 RepID=UPI0020A0BDA1|nr:alpha/beta hydrolase [Halorussus salilacus]USZ68154.1 alpha/beta hydrolase [Halorussus salilacus]